MKKIWWFNLLLLMAVFNPAFTQDVEVRLTVTINQDLQTLFLSDLDLAQIGTAEQLFQLSIINHSGQAYEQCVLTLSLLKDNEQLAVSESYPFLIPEDLPGTEYKTSNVELINNRFFLRPGDGATQVRFKTSQISSDAEDLQKQILASGKVPMGIYKLVVQLTVPVQQIQASDEAFLLTATNPSYLRLVAPGGPVDIAQPPVIFTQFPLFQWQGNGEVYQVLVFEKKSGIVSLDDILTMKPNWQSPPVQGLSVAYPQSGEAVPLEYGKTYYWMVRMIINTSSGIQYQNSEIWTFKLQNPAEGDITQGDVVKDDLVNFLRDLMGSKGDEVARRLEGYRITRVVINGREISLQELQQMLNLYRNRRVSVQDLIMPSAQ